VQGQVGGAQVGGQAREQERHKPGEPLEWSQRSEASF
jgi:hypothetical protein